MKLLEIPQQQTETEVRRIRLACDDTVISLDRLDSVLKFPGINILENIPDKPGIFRILKNLLYSQILTREPMPDPLPGRLLIFRSNHEQEMNKRRSYSRILAVI